MSYTSCITPTTHTEACTFLAGRVQSRLGSSHIRAMADFAGDTHQRPSILEDVLPAPGLADVIGQGSGARASCCARAASRLMRSCLADVTAALMRNPMPDVYLVGGHSGRGQGPHLALEAVERLDTARQRWETMPSSPVPSPRIDCVAVALAACVYVLGGRDGRASDDQPATATAERLNTALGSWEQLPPMRTARYSFAAAVRSGEVCVVGGCVGYETLSDCEAFSAAAGSWRPLPPLALARGRCAGAAIRKSMYVIGGGDEGYRSLSNIDRLVPDAQTWQALPAMPTARAACSAVAMAGALFVAGGVATNWTPQDCFERFDPAEGVWSTLPALDVPRWDFAMVGCACGGKIYILGGLTYGGRCTSSVECFCIESERWQPAGPRLKAGRSGCAAAAVL